MAKTPVIQLKNVIKKYQVGEEELTILKGISFEIYAGEYIILFGASGSGKSTILNTVAGLEPPTEGEVTIRGENISKFTGKELARYRRSKIGIVFQQFNLIKTFKVWENVAFPLTCSREPRRRRRERAMTLLRLLGLERYANRLPNELSGGQQQRVAIARALAINPWIVIADEPTGNLDSKSADEVMEIFRLLNRQSKRTIVMVTHNPEYLREATRVIHVRDGEIMKIATNAHPAKFDGDVKGLDDLASLHFNDEKTAEKKEPGKDKKKETDKPAETEKEVKAAPAPKEAKKK